MPSTSHAVCSLVKPCDTDLVDVRPLQLHEEVLVQERQRQRVLCGGRRGVAAHKQLVAFQSPPVRRFQPLLIPEQVVQLVTRTRVGLSPPLVAADARQSAEQVVGPLTRATQEVRHGLATAKMCSAIAALRPRAPGRNSHHLLAGPLLADVFPLHQLHVILQMRIGRHRGKREAACGHRAQA